MSMEQESEDLKWIIEHLLEICEEYYPDYDTCYIIEDSVKIYEQYYEN